jgi:hypothetical protein
MRKFYLSLIIILLQGPLYGQVQEEQVLSKEEIEEDLQACWTALTEMHPSLDRYTSANQLKTKLDKLIDRREPRFSSIAFYNLLSPIISEIRCGHTKLYLPESLYSSIVNGKKLFPLTLLFEGSEAFVKGDFSTEGTLPKGTQVLSINNMPIKQFIDTSSKEVSADGFITTSQKYKLQKDLIISIVSTFGFPDTFRVELKDHTFVELEALNISKLRANIKRISGGVNANKPLRLELIPEKHTALLIIETFERQLISQNDQEFEKFIDNAFKLIKKEKAKNLILDLRNNGGGSAQLGRLLFSYLYDDSFIYQKPIGIAFGVDKQFSFDSLIQNKDDISSFKSRIKQNKNGSIYLYSPNSKSMKSNKYSFEGKLYVLINGASFSATANLAANIKEKGIGTLVGEETAGAYEGYTAGERCNLLLPNSKLRLEIPLERTLNLVSDNKAGRGVQPDISIPFSLHDFIEGRDTDLDELMKILD